ncbi:MAG: hypothetical protein SGBAC_007150 [Bacillariaceae sp.]
MKKADVTKASFLLSTPAPSETTGANPMSNTPSHPTRRSQESLIDEALEIMDSLEPTSKPCDTGPRGPATARKCSFHKSGSSLSEERVCELLTDSSFRLSELLRSCSNMDDSESDDEDDLEV